MYCSKCGANVPDGAAFCNSCGQPTAGVAAGQPAAATPPPVAGSPVYAPPAQPGWQAPAARPPVAYAGFWLRFVAAIIDGIIIGIPFAPIFFLLIFSALPSIRGVRDPMEMFTIIMPRLFLVLVVSLVGSWLYWGLMESSGWQATLGKKALGLYVTDLTGHRITFGRASGRFFAGRGLSYVLSIGGLYFLVDCICAGFTEKKQALHDMIASCLVLRKP
jgi:uncharacterized RDD family membrane protein YckC